MSDFLKCACPHCQINIEFPTQDAGRICDCPSCGKSLQLPQPQISPMGLPELANESFRSIKIRSSDGKRIYDVNLVDYTCTCDSFAEVHSKAYPRDFGRLCKHMCKALNNPEIIPLLDPICSAIVKEGFGVYPGRFDRDVNGKLLYVTGVNSSGWVNVFAVKRSDGKTYYRFGYSMTDDRWSYGQQPRVNTALLFSESPAANFATGSTQSSHPVLTGIWKVVWFILKALGFVVMALLLAILSGGRKKRRR